MKRHISIFPFLLSAFAACSLAQDAFSTSFAIIANEQMSIPYDAGVRGQGSYTLSGEVSAPEKYYYWWGSLLEDLVLTAESRPGRSFGWYTLEQNDTTDYGVNTSVSKCTVSLTTELSITEKQIKTANTSERFGYVICPKYAYIPLTITFDGNGATSGSTESVTNKNYDSEFCLPTNGYVRTGYEFGGWSTNKGGKVVFEDGASVRGSDFWNEGKRDFDSKLFAVWTQSSFAVTVDSKGHGSVSKNPDRASYDRDTTVTLSAAPDEGYAFAAWSDGSPESSHMITVVSNASYSATFTNCVYTMTFDLNDKGEGATCDVSWKRVAYQDPIGKLPEPTWAYHSFIGWFTAREGGDQITEITKEGNQRYVWVGDITLYAQWNDATAFDVTAACEPKQAGSVSVEGTKIGGRFVDGTEIVLTATPSNGYSFAYWQKGPFVLTDNPLTTNVTGQAEYVAVFTGNVYEVYFDANGGQFEDGSEDAVVPYVYGQAFGMFPVCAREEYDLEGWFTGKKAGKRIDAADIFELSDPEVDVLELWAHWTLKPTYAIAFDGNGATGGTMPNQKAYCGVPTNLRANAFVRGGSVFLGWSTNEAPAAVDFTDGAAVTDLAAEGQTCTVYAVWRPLTLSEAMHCTNLHWESVTNAWHSSKIEWTGVYEEGEGFEGSGSCVRQLALSEAGIPQMLTTKLAESGTLSFRWKGKSMAFNISDERDDTKSTIHRLDSGVGEWNCFSTNLVVTTETETWVHIWNYTRDSAVDIDQMTWVPKGTHPEPTDADKVTISSAAILDGKFSLSFMSDARFDYNLLTNDNLLINSWGVMTNEVGTGGPITFEPEIIEGQPRLFYRVETIQKK